MSIMVSKELLDEAIDHAVITMRNVRKLSPVRDNNFGVVRVTILSIGFWASRNTGVSFLIGIITVLGSSIALMTS
jgi:putative ABC transport system permease protein